MSLYEYILLRFIFQVKFATNSCYMKIRYAQFIYILYIFKYI